MIHLRFIPEQRGFYIDSDFQTIIKATYREFLEELSEKTTTPNGIKPKMHLRTYIHFTLTDGEDFEEKSEQINEGEDTKQRCKELEQFYGNELEKINIFYELWSWGIKGNHPDRKSFFDDFETAERALYHEFEMDVREEDQRPSEFYLTKEEAKKGVKKLNGLMI